MIRFDKVTPRYTSEGMELVLRLPFPSEANSFLAEYKEGTVYQMTPKLYRKKRSLDANAYAWVLLDKLSERIGRPATEIYRGLIKDVGENCTTVCVVSAACEELIKNWQSNGIGWVADSFPSKIDGCENVRLYYGSSQYDTAQMSRLLNLIIEECEQQGIETDRRIETLIEAWEGVRK